MAKTDHTPDMPIVQPSELYQAFAKLVPAERQALRYICDNGDYIEVAGAGRFLLVPMPDTVAEVLEVFEADLADEEPELDDQGCDDEGCLDGM